MDDNVIRFPLLQAVLKDRSFHDEITPDPGTAVAL
jgi:hypothetical protein